MNKNASNLAEVKLSYSNKEFVNFYDWHRTLCDEIAGIKIIAVRTVTGQDETVIGRDNFALGIRRLHAFILNYAHDFDETSKEKEIFSDVVELENDFISDTSYSKLSLQIEPLSLSQEAEYNIKYFEYLIRCFRVIEKASKFLQSSMMIGSSNIRKLVEWYDTKPFFDNLSDYRRELCNSLSYFTVGDLLKHYRKTLAYHFTYRIHCEIKELNAIDKIIDWFSQNILVKSYLEFIYKVRDNIADQRRVMHDNVVLKRALFNIIKLTNKSLMNRSILPKIKKRVLVDRTGI